MAARSFTLKTSPLKETEEMARTTSDEKVLLDAINNSRVDAQKGFSDLNVNVAGLRSDVAHLGKSLDTLSIKVDAIDRDKAPRADLTAAELRWKESITDFRARTEKDLDGKIGKDEFSVDSFQSFDSRLEEVSKQTAILVTGYDTNHTMIIELKADLSSVSEKITSLNSIRDQAYGVKWMISLIGSALGGGGVFWVLQHLLK